MILLLDTNAVWHRGLMDTLATVQVSAGARGSPVEVILPSIAYAERARQLAGDKRRRRLLDDELSDVGARIEPFGAVEADRLAGRAPEEDVWREHARDFLIAAHAREGRIIVTDDQGPAWEGLDVLTPGQATELVEVLVG